MVAPELERFDPTWILISAGFDAHRDDPLTGMGLTAGDFADLTARIAALAPRPGRLVAFLEGGYGLDGLRDSVAASLPALIDGPAMRPEAASSGRPRHGSRDSRARPQVLTPQPRRFQVTGASADTAASRSARRCVGSGRGSTVLDLDQLLHEAVQREASDVHIKVGSRPFLRIDGNLEQTNHDEVQSADTERIAFAIMPKQRAEEFLTANEADFAYAVAGLGRFRVNVFRQRGSVGMVLRRVLPGIPSFEELGLPPAVRRLADEPRGLVLVTGPTGSGKTTTLACMIDHINETQRRHIVTIEDPIEVLHNDKQSIVNQREIGTDTDDFHSALKRAMRQDPDVILIGEMRDPETVWASIAAAETGHLVFSTLHTISATDTINRIIDFFPPFQQRQVRMSVASSLRGIISQRLLPTADGAGRVPAMEILVATGSGVRQDRRFRRHPRDRGDHRRRRLLRDADLRPEPPLALREGNGEPARRDGDGHAPARPPAPDRPARDDPGRGPEGRRRSRRQH